MKKSVVILLLAFLFVLLLVAGASYVFFSSQVRKSPRDFLPTSSSTTQAPLPSPDVQLPVYGQGARVLSDFSSRYAEFIQSASVELNVRGKVEKIVPGSLTLSIGGKTLTIEDGEKFAKTSFYDQLGTTDGRLTRITLGDMKPGDTVLVTVVADAKDGRRRVRAVYRIAEGAAIDRLLLY